MVNSVHRSRLVPLLRANNLVVSNYSQLIVDRARYKKTIRQAKRRMAFKEIHNGFLALRLKKPTQKTADTERILDC